MRIAASVSCIKYSRTEFSGVLDPLIETPYPWSLPQYSSIPLITGFMKLNSVKTVGQESYGYLSDTVPICHGDNAVTHIKSESLAYPEGCRLASGELVTIAYGSTKEPLCYYHQTTKVTNFDYLYPGPDEDLFVEVYGRLTPKDPYGPWTWQGGLWFVNWDKHTIRRATLSLATSISYRADGFTAADTQANARVVLSRLLDRSNWYIKQLPIDLGNFPVYTIRANETVMAKNHDPSIGCYQWALRFSQPDLQEADLARSNIALSVANQCGRMTSNNAALALEIYQLIKDAAALIRGDVSVIQRIRRVVTRLPKTFKGKAKLLANLRLSEQYGVKLTVADLRELIAFQRAKLSGLITARSAASWYYHDPLGSVQVTEHWKCWFDQNRAYEHVISKLLRDDLVGFQNVWDFIPYSFVADWFTPAGDILQAWDDELMLSQMSFDAIIVGTKAVCVKHTVGEGCDIVTTTTRYSRERRSSFPPVIHITTSVTPNLRMVLNGAALIVQRL